MKKKNKKINNQITNDFNHLTFKCNKKAVKVTMVSEGVFAFDIPKQTGKKVKIKVHNINKKINKRKRIIVP